MNPLFVDFHCHLDLYPDPVTAIANADAAGVYTLTVTTTPKAWPRNLTLTQRTRYVRAALGFHPQLVADRFGELSLWEHYLPETRYVGEVGIDAGPRYCHSIDLQKKIFGEILKQCAKAGGKVLTVHSVRATAMVLDMIEEHLPSRRGLTVLHWFTGSKSEARRAVDLGCYFSVNARMMQTDRGRDLVISLPSGRLLTETDGPFTQVSGRPSCPADIAMVVEKIAGLHQMTTDEMAGTIRKNLRTILGTVEKLEEKS